MKTHLLYVVISSDKDIYLEQAYLSMYSAKRYNPDCSILLLTDNHTAATFSGIRKQLVSLVDTCVTIDLDPALSAHTRSRMLKTGARQYVQGDFLFIDTDTIITSSLQEIDMQTASVAACIDSHTTLAQNPYKRRIRTDVHALGWAIDDTSDYFNSGVIYVKDDAAGHAFYHQWQRIYLEGAQKGVKMDQPSFYAANAAVHGVVQRLPDVWNCELKHGIRFIQTAKIVHYLCTNISKAGDNQVSLLNERRVFNAIKASGEIPAEVYACIDDPLAGLNEQTTIVAGLDCQILQTYSYAALKKLYTSPAIFNKVEYCLKFCHERFKKLTRGGAALFHHNSTL